jgi:malate dehydrogenase (oxaloacetate-decarboxylating)
VFLSVDHPDLLEESFRDYGLGPDDVDLIVATDAEGILGIGDWGVGGIDIAIGKLAVYIAAAGIHPRRVIPVVLDMGTDNLHLLNDPMYLGNRHARVRGQRYDDFIDTYVTAATKLFPRALLHWEDLGASNARRILQRYADQCCTFNDDMQGTAAVVLAAALAAEEATRRFWCLGRQGLLTDDRADQLLDFQQPYARPAAEVAGWTRTGTGRGPSLADVVGHVHPTMLIGTSTQAGAFTEAIVRQMAAHVERPVIMPLSNPTSRSEAVPAALIAWTDGRALVATGSPFDPVVHEDTTYRIAQANNALVFPGLGLGVAVARARRVSDRMLAAAADAVAGLSDATTPGAALLPPVDNLREVSATVATAAVADGLAEVTLDNPIQQVHEAMWQPEYARVEAV